MPPTGTVSFLFSDIEGSTRLLHTIGQRRYEARLNEHCHLLRTCFARHAGYEVKTAGDSFFVAFASARDAAQSSIEVQRALAAKSWPADERVRVRIGIHTCEAAPTGSDYIGIGVHLTARICAAAHGEQILLSQATRDLLENDFENACTDLGTHRVKDFPRPQRLFQVADPSLLRDFPPLRAPNDRAGNLPSSPSPLVGREAELSAVCALLRKPEFR